MVSETGISHLFWLKIWVGSDGKNLPFLVQQCHFIAWSAVLFKEDMLKDSLIPGYPKETGEKALAIWCALLAGTGEWALCPSMFWLTY